MSKQAQANLMGEAQNVLRCLIGTHIETNENALPVASHAYIQVWPSGTALPSDVCMAPESPSLLVE